MSTPKLRRAEARRVLLPANGLPRTPEKTIPIHLPAKSRQGSRQGVPKRESKRDWSKLEEIVLKIKEAKKDPEFRKYLREWNRIAPRYY